MKKFFIRTLPIVCCLLICLCPLFLSGCGDDEFANLNINFSKKYYEMKYLDNLDNSPYYVFYQNGKGVYVSNNGSNKIHFKYTKINNNKIMCFYNSSEGFTTNPPTSWYREFVVSKNVIKYTANGLSGTMDYYFICENYIPQIPNFDS